MWGGKAKMKKLCFILSLVLTLSMFFAGCELNQEIELTDTDNEIIETVYGLYSEWDIPTDDNDHINRIKFFDFDGAGTVSFFMTYDVNYVLGKGYYILDNGTMERIKKESVYDTDTQIRYTGCIGTTMGCGTQWNQSYTDEEKYETIKNAYIEFLENIKRSE